MSAPREGPAAWHTVAEVLGAELRLVRPEWASECPELPHDPEHPYDPAPLREHYARLAGLQGATPGSRTLAALCLSGGGIRSATFNLGVIQAFARLGVLPAFDFLSTVSGGGYIGSWLQGWIAARHQAGLSGPEAVAAVVRDLAGHGADPAPDPLAPEPGPIDRLREFSNYLTPRKGALSGDTWALVAIVLRNLLLNWTVVVPLLAAVVAVPLMAAHLAGPGRPLLAAGGRPAALGALALSLALVSSTATHALRRARRGPPPTDDEAVRRRRSRLRALWTAGTLGLFLAASALLVGVGLGAGDPLAALPLAPPGPGAPPLARALAAAVWTVGVPVAGALLVRLGAWAAARARPAAAGATADPPPAAGRGLVADLTALAASGAAAAAALAWLTDGPWRALMAHPRATAVLALPALLVVYALARAVFTAVGSLLDARGVGGAGDEPDREWWARITGRVLLAAAIWAVGSAVALLGGTVAGEAWRWVTGGAVTVGSVAGLALALLGRGAGTSSGRGSRAEGSRAQELALRAAAPAVLVAVFVLLAQVDRAAAARLAPPAAPAGHLLALGEVAVGLVAVSLVAGFFVDVNRFSLHRMYRNRLVRAYLGASHQDRRPNAVSGFDPADGEVRLADLVRGGGPMKLFPIVNATLNLVRGDRLAWQERQAESFSMTPLFAGNFYEGYRPAAAYGGPRGGLSLGSAMAISGAAASPNMGYASAPIATFLMGLLNARLGVWLANPNRRTPERLVGTPGPWHASAHLLRELLGATDRFAPYVNLSDGGHFDNLGLYEVILRRCRLVVVSDAGCDPRSTFADLGSAVRKVRIDFGIPITFDQGVEILGRGRDGAPPRRPGLYCAVGTIHYDAADGAGAPPGTIVYLKPTLASAGQVALPRDVLAYAAEAGAFPHEPTTDQWFSETQFESYRALGAHLVEVLVARDQPVRPLAGGLAELLEAVQRHVHAAAAGAPAPAPVARVAG